MVGENSLDINSVFQHWPSCALALDEQGKIVAVSAKAAEEWGWPGDELIGRTIHQALCSNDRVNAHTEDKCRFQHSESHDGDEYASCFFIARDGHCMSLDYKRVDCGKDQHPVKELLFFSDNSERMYSQDEMQKFTAMLEQSPSPVVEFDHFGQIIYGNSAFGDLLDRYDFDDSGSARVLPADTEALCRAILESAEKSIISSEAAVDGQYFEWHFQVIEASGMKKIISYGFDITEKVQTQRSVEEEKTKLRKEFLAKMVHELRTPLNAIVGFSDILLSRIGNSMEKEHRKRLESIKSAGTQLNHMITDTLEFSKLESGKLTVEISEFCLASLCSAVYEQMHTLAEQKGLQYQHQFLTKNTIASDENKLRQIIVNVVSNAIKYTPEGKVNLLLSEVNDYQLGDCFKVVVIDTGVGISENHIDSLFDSYTKVENEKTAGIEGTGLGLSLVRDMTSILGGRISVSSIVDKGSVFELVFPKRYQKVA